MHHFFTMRFFKVKSAMVRYRFVCNEPKPILLLKFAAATCVSGAMRNDKHAMRNEAAHVLTTWFYALETWSSCARAQFAAGATPGASGRGKTGGRSAIHPASLLVLLAVLLPLLQVNVWDGSPDSHARVLGIDDTGLAAEGDRGLVVFESLDDLLRRSC